MDFLVWLMSSGGGIAVASWIAERIPAFQGLTARMKEFLLFAASAVFSVAAYAVTVFVNPAVLESIAPWFLIVSGIFSTIVVGKIFHSADKRT